MKCLLLTIICLASSLLVAQRPWDPDETRAEFDIRHDFSGGVYGSKLKRIGNIIADLDDLRKTLPNVTNPTMKGIIGSLERLKALDELTNLESNGGKNDLNGSLNLRLRNTIVARDCISLGYSYRSETVSSPVAKLDDLFGHRLFIVDPNTWLSGLDALLQNATVAQPGIVFRGYTKGGEKFEHDLVDLGYPKEIAGLLAYICEKAGINFSGYTAKLISNILENQLFDIGSEVGNVYDLLQRSGIKTQSLVTQKYSVGYNACITDYFRIGGVLNYLRVSDDSDFMRIGRINAAAMYLPRKPSKERSYFMFDAFTSFTPADRFFIDLSLFNIGANPNSGKHMQGHIDIVYDGDIFKCGVGIDTNPVPDTCVKWIHYQYLTTYVGVEPNYEKTGLGFRVTARRNVGDSDEPTLIGLSLSLTLWCIKISGGGESALEFTNLNGLSIPDRFNWHAQISVNIKW